MKYFIGYLIQGETAVWHVDITKNISGRFNTWKIYEKLPPHITILYPFETNNIGPIIDLLKDWVRDRQINESFSLLDFDRFDDKVIFAKVEANQSVKNIVEELRENLKKIPGMSKDDFPVWHPHSTLANRLSPEEINQIWNYVLTLKKPNYILPFDNVTIFRFEDNREWIVEKSFKLHSATQPACSKKTLMENKNKYLYKDRKYDVVPYSTEWPLQFKEYSQRIQSIFGDIPIEHIGSTSVPLMSGKPCIDVLVLVHDLKKVEENLTSMEKAGFEYSGEFVMPDSRLFRVMKDNVLLANIHFFKEKHPHVKEMLSLRDYLRSNPKEAEEYSSLKKVLCEKYPNDYASYRKYKDEYMEKLKKKVASNMSL